MTDNGFIADDLAEYAKWLEGRCIETMNRTMERHYCSPVMRVSHDILKPEPLPEQVERLKNVCGQWGAK